MVTPFIAVRFVAATVLLGSIALAGSAMAKPATTEAALAAPAAASTSVPAAVAVTAPIAVPEAPSACARKVKVVYAGYGEADRAGCTAAKSAAK